MPSLYATASSCPNTGLFEDQYILSHSSIINLTNDPKGFLPKKILKNLLKEIAAL